MTKASCSHMALSFTSFSYFSLVFLRCPSCDLKLFMCNVTLPDFVHRGHFHPVRGSSWISCLYWWARRLSNPPASHHITWPCAEFFAEKKRYSAVFIITEQMKAWICGNTEIKWIFQNTESETYCLAICVQYSILATLFVFCSKCSHSQCVKYEFCMWRALSQGSDNRQYVVSNKTIIIWHSMTLGCY